MYPPVGDLVVDTGGVFVPLPVPPNRNLKNRLLSVRSGAVAGAGCRDGSSVGLADNGSSCFLVTLSAALPVLKLLLRPSFVNDDGSSSDIARVVLGRIIAAEPAGPRFRLRSVEASRSLYRFHPTSLPALAPPERFNASSSISLFERSKMRLDLASVRVVSRSC